MRFLRLALPAFFVDWRPSPGRRRAAGLLIPEDKKLPPLAMVNHKVTVTIDDQVAVTTVEQTFRNHTDRNLEATYLFPVPKGASVRQVHHVGGRQGDRRRTARRQEGPPDLHRHRPPHPGPRPARIHRQQPAAAARLPGAARRATRRSKISYKSIAPKDGGLVEYVYPLKTDGKGTGTLEEFSVKVDIKSQHPIQNIYSPTHADHHRPARATRKWPSSSRSNQALLDKDFQLFYGSATRTSA